MYQFLFGFSLFLFPGFLNLYIHQEVSFQAHPKRQRIYPDLLWQLQLFYSVFFSFLLILFTCRFRFFHQKFCIFYIFFRHMVISGQRRMRMFQSAANRTRLADSNFSASTKACPFKNIWFRQSQFLRASSTCFSETAAFS